MSITFTQLMQAIEDATARKDIKVPCQDYYARAGDTTTETLVYIDPHKLIECLQEMENPDDIYT